MRVKSLKNIFKMAERLEKEYVQNPEKLTELEKILNLLEENCEEKTLAIVFRDLHLLEGLR